MTFNAIMRRFVALLACICLSASGTGAVWAQAANGLPELNLSTSFNAAEAAEIQLFLAQADTGDLGFDITAPTIAHTPSATRGVAGEMQSIVAEINDNQSVRRAALIYRTSTAEFYTTAEMSADVTNTTWLATVDTTAEDTELFYYIVAEDADGNRVQKGSESSPLTLELQQPELISAIAPVKQNNRRTWLAVGLGVILLGALVAAGASSGSDDGAVSSDGSAECCTVTINVPNVTTN